MTGPSRKAPPERQAGQDTVQPSAFLNRELSLLAFQRRVLAEARDPRNPLLERAKFLAIVASNLDEFFMTRVGGLKMQLLSQVTELPPDGLSVTEQLVAIRQEAHGLLGEVRQCMNQELRPDLAKAGVHVLDYGDLNRRQKSALGRYFEKIVFPVLTPLAVDPGRPFPHISNLSLNLAILVRDRRGHERFARLKIPPRLPRLVPVPGPTGDGATPGPGQEHYLVWLEQVVAANLAALFPGLKVLGAYPFHVTRNAELVIRELEADDLLDLIEESVARRRFRPVVRLKIQTGTPAAIRAILVRNLEITEDDVYAVDAPLALSGFMSLYGLERPDLKYPPFQPGVPARLRPEPDDGDPFGAIRGGGILLHHPYDSFRPVVDFIRRATQDPQVLAVKQTLYRVGSNSPVVEALLEAPQQGKEVATLVELKARFDEESNIEWAKALEREGVHVIYGLVGLKTHSKVALVVREEQGAIRRYVHLATGNYNAVTAQRYTDLGYFTCDERIGEDASHLFNYLTGYADKRDYQKLLVAPVNMRQRIEALIRHEMDIQRLEGGGHLIFKMNALVDRRMIQLLYAASQAGVKVDLIVRGICCLRPGVPGLSESIRVVSVVGRFLEHSRIYYFRNGGAERVYLGSADLMPRNLNFRVEVLFPVEDQAHVRYVRDEVLELALRDNVKAREMQPDGSYRRVTAAEGSPPVDSQALLLARHAGHPRP